MAMLNNQMVTENDDSIDVYIYIYMYIYIYIEVGAGSESFGKSDPSS